MKDQTASIIKTVLILFIITFVVRASNNMVRTNTPLFSMYSLNFNNLEIGFLAALFGLMVVVGSLINARLGYNKRRRAFILSNVIYGPIIFLFYFANSTTIWILIAFFGLCDGIMMPNLITAASLFKNREHRDRAIAIYTLALSSSLLVGPIIEYYLLLFYTLRQTFLIFSIFGLIAAVISPTINFPRVQAKKENVKVSVGDNPGFRVAVLSVLAYDLPFVMLVTFAGIYAKNNFNISLSTIQLIFAGLFLTSFIARVGLSIKPAKRIGHLIFAAVLITLIGLILLFLSPNIIIFAFVILLLGIPHGLTYPLAFTAIGRTFSEHQRAKANSYIYSIFGILGITVPVIGGTLITMIGMSYAFLSLVIPSSILLVLTWIEINKTNKL